MLKELADMVFMLGNFNIAYRLYTILHERLLKEPAFVLYMAGARVFFIHIVP